MSKLGRNEPCHCKSGKKYKKCHLNLDAGFTYDEKTRTYSKQVFTIPPEMLARITGGPVGKAVMKESEENTSSETTKVRFRQAQRP